MNVIRTGHTGILAASVIAAALAFAPSASAQPTQAGVSSAVSGEVDRTSPATQRPKAPMGVGEGIFMRDEIGSEVESLAQILLLDESVFTIGPNSEVLIDEFVYDPDTGAGTLVANAVKGSFRFISGRIGATTPQNISIKTPSAVIGVRGTSLLVDIVRDAAGAVVEERFVLTGPGNRNNANQKPGRITVAAGGVTVPILRTGWGTFVRPGRPPTGAAPFPFEIIAEINGRLSAAIVTAQRAADATAQRAVGDSGATSAAGQDTAGAAPLGEVNLDQAGTTDFVATQVAGTELESQAGAVPSQFLAASLTTVSDLLSLPPGVATYTQNGVPLFFLSDIDTFSVNQLGSTTASSPEGSYNFLATVNLGAQTYNIQFLNINVATLGLFGGSLIQSDSYSSDVGIAAAFLSDSFDGNVACQSAGCEGFAILLNDGSSIAANALHALAVGSSGEIVGGGIAPKM